MRNGTVAAWIRECSSSVESDRQIACRAEHQPPRKRCFVGPSSQGRPAKRQRKRECAVLAAASSSKLNKMSSPQRRRTTSTRTPSPSKRDHDHHLDDETPRQQPAKRGRKLAQRSSRLGNAPIPDMSYTQSLFEEGQEVDLGVDVGLDILPGKSRVHGAFSDRSSSVTGSTARSASPKKVSDLRQTGNGVQYELFPTGRQSLQQALGSLGYPLHKKLAQLAMTRGIFPARLEEMLATSFPTVAAADLLDIDIDPAQLDPADTRPTDELKAEWEQIAALVESARICAREGDPEAEWNQRIHFRILDLVFERSNEQCAGYRSVTSTKLLKDYQPSHMPAASAHRIIDAVIFLGAERGGSFAHAIRQYLGPLNNINHFQYDGLCERPVAVAIETKTESRPLAEAKVQLGVWAASQIARLESVVEDIEDVEAQTLRLAAATSASLGQLQDGAQRTGSRCLDPQRNVPVIRSDEASHLHQLLLPLICVNANQWHLYFARPLPIDEANSLAISKDDSVRKPQSSIVIYNSLSIGGTDSITNAYQLIRSLNTLRDWVNKDYRKWWEGLLFGTGIVGDGS